MKKTEQEFSPRSTASVLREMGMLEKIAHLDKELSYVKRKTGEAEETKQNCLKTFAKGKADAYDGISLDKANRELMSLDARAQSLKQFKAEIEHTLKAERAIVPGRAAVQAQIAGLAEERLKADAGIEEILQQLRAALESRAQTTARMAELAEGIEFSGDLDGKRFEELFASLPSILPESERRKNALLGEGFTVRAMARVLLQRPENLRNSGIALPGQEVLLTQEEFDELSRADVPHPFAGDPGENGRLYGNSTYLYERPWALAPQRVCSVEQFEADKSEAERTGSNIEKVWVAQNMARDEAAKQKYIEERDAQIAEVEASTPRHMTIGRGA